MLTTAQTSSALAEAPRAAEWRTVVYAVARATMATSWTTVVRPAATVMTASLGPQRTGYGPAAHALDGLASFYWQGERTANGEPFDKDAMTGAHRTLPFNSRVRVTNVGNGRSVIVRINDRGPFIAGRVIDVSDAAAAALGMRGSGLAPVRLELLR